MPNPADLQTRIGRPIDPVWAAEFTQAFDYYFPKRVTYIPIVQPGVIYVDNYELYQAMDGGNVGEGSLDEYAENYTRRELSELVSRGDLPPSITEPIKEVEISDVSFKPWQRRRDGYLQTRLFILLEDIIPESAVDYLIESERGAVTRLMIPNGSFREPSTRLEGPLHKVNIGNVRVESDKKDVSRVKLLPVLEALPSLVELSPLGGIGIHFQGSSTSR